MVPAKYSGHWPYCIRIMALVYNMHECVTLGAGQNLYTRIGRLPKCISFLYGCFITWLHCCMEALSCSWMLILFLYGELIYCVVWWFYFNVSRITSCSHSLFIVIGFDVLWIDTLLIVVLSLDPQVGTTHTHDQLRGGYVMLD